VASKGGWHACDVLLTSCQYAAAGLLASGLVPAVRHSLLHLLTADARVLPAAATVFMQVRARRRALQSNLVLMQTLFRERACAAWQGV
jgi:hypothetical protein